MSLSEIVIDLGTSGIKVCWVGASGDLELLRWKGSYYLPSVIHLPMEESDILVGNEALEAAEYDPLGLVENFKRDLMEDGVRRQTHADRQDSDQALMNAWFVCIRDACFAQMPELGNVMPENITVTVPARRQVLWHGLLQEGAESIGVLHPQIVKEPVAAARGWLDMKSNAEDASVLVIDCGGGTTDWALVEKRGTKYSLSPELRPGSEYLGGCDVDKALLARVMTECADRVQKIPPQAILQKLKLFKESVLSGKDADPIRLGGRPIPLDAETVRKLYREYLIEPLIAKLDGVLAKAQDVHSDTTVLLVGGGVNAELQEALSKATALSVEIHPEPGLAVVKGMLSGVIRKVEIKPEMALDDLKPKAEVLPPNSQIKASILKKSFFKLIIQVHISNNIHTIVCKNSISSQKLYVDDAMIFEHASYTEFISEFDLVIKDDIGVFEGKLFVHVNRFGYKIESVELFIRNELILSFDDNKDRKKGVESYKFTENTNSFNKMLVDVFSKHKSSLDLIVYPYIKEKTIKEIRRKYRIEEKNEVVSYDSKNLIVYTKFDIRSIQNERPIIIPYVSLLNTELTIESGIQSYKIVIGSLLSLSFFNTTQQDRMIRLYHDLKNLAVSIDKRQQFNYLGNVDTSGLNRNQRIVLEQVYLYSLSDRFVMYPDADLDSEIAIFKKRVREDDTVTLGLYDTSFKKRRKNGIIFFESKCIVLNDDQYASFEYGKLESLDYVDTFFRRDISTDNAGPVTVAGGGFLAMDIVRLLKDIQSHLVNQVKV